MAAILVSGFYRHFTGLSFPGGRDPGDTKGRGQQPLPRCSFGRTFDGYVLVLQSGGGRGRHIQQLPSLGAVLRQNHAQLWHASLEDELAAGHGGHAGVAFGARAAHG